MSAQPLKNSDLGVLEDLERRFGPAMAQQIMDELKKAETRKKVASNFNYIGAKALSEMAEIYREEARTKLRLYKSHKGTNAHNERFGLQDTHNLSLKKDFEYSFHLYRRFYKGFFIVYREAMHSYTTQMRHTHIYALEDNVRLLIA